MSEAAQWLDGNALAGPLEELFGADLTAAPRRCQSCGSVRPVGEHRLYRGAGLVLRCPVCGAIGLRLATLRDRHILHMEGMWRLELPDREEGSPGR
jgi:hypothetical protein